EVEADGELAGGQADRPLEPRPPLLLADGVRVFDLRAPSGVEGEPSTGVLEEQPDFLERVPVELLVPVHGLAAVWAAAVRLKVEFAVAEGVLAVVAVGPLGVVGEAVHRDPDEVAGDRLGAGVVEGSAYRAAVGAVAVGEGGFFPLHDEAA